jgi:hypothetical protein
MILIPIITAKHKQISHSRERFFVWKIVPRLFSRIFNYISDCLYNYAKPPSIKFY